MLPMLFAILTACAFSLPYELLDTAEIGALMPEHTVLEKVTAFLPVLGKRMYPQCILLFLLFLFLYRVVIPKIRAKHFSMSAFLTGVLFSFYLIAGECGIAYKDLAALFKTVPQIVIVLLKICGWLPLFYIVIRAAFVYVDEHKSLPIKGHISSVIFEKHAFFAPLLIILVCWLPYIVAFYPGFVPSDGLKQLNNFFGSGNFTDNHPAFTSMLLGWAMRLGRAIGSDNLGIFLFTGPQMLINAAAMAGCFPLFKQLNTPGWFRKLVLADFALIPIWPNYAYSLLKDSLYMAMILLFVQMLIKIIKAPRTFCSRALNLIFLMITMCFLMLFRHEGQYVISLVFLTLFTLPQPRKHWKKLVPILLIPLCLVNIFNRVIRPALSIDDAPAREALTMAFRQTSSIVVNMEESLTADESDVLHELFVYEKIPEMYSISTENADLLKGQFDPWASKDAILRYLKVWLSLGIKHPLTYLNVFLCSNTRYYDPFLTPYRDIYGWFGIEQAEYVNQGLFDIYYQPRTAFLRSALINLANGLPYFPMTSLFYSLGFNAWLMIFCFAFSLRKKIHGVIIPFLPGLITFVLIQHSAVNGFFRYMLPLLITLPLAFAWILSDSSENLKQE